MTDGTGLRSVRKNPQSATVTRSVSPVSSFRRAAVSAAVVLMLALQTFVVGFTAAMAGETGAGAVCATAKASDGSDKTTPDKHACPCCIIHCSSIADFDDVNGAPSVILPLEISATGPVSEFSPGTVIAAPELRPSSPRAPPARV